MTVYFTSIQSIQKKYSFNNLLEKLPEALHYELNAYKKHTDRLVRATSRILLQYVLRLKKYPNDTILYMNKNKYGKPFIPNCFWFNIAHSGDIIMLAVNDTHTIGIDIELMKMIEWKKFKTCFTNKEWQIISKSNNPVFMFYDFWTRKESVLKADGRGLTLDMSEIDVSKKEVIGEPYTGNWYLCDISFDSYKAFVCSKTRLQNIPLHFVEQI